MSKDEQRTRGDRGGFVPLGELAIDLSGVQVPGAPPREGRSPCLISSC